MNRIFIVILVLLCALTSCGRKGPLTYPEGQKKPKFDKISDEMSKPAK